jgi:hypothetical protein
MARALPEPGRFGEGGGVAAGRRRKADAALALALACGATPESAAQKADVSLRTAYRRLADAAFRAQVDEVRAEVMRRSTDMFTAAGLSAIKTLMTLQDSAESESVRLGAARAVIELGCKLREKTETTARIAALEGEFETLLGEADRLADA